MEQPGALAGRRAVVVGVASEIGAACARRFAADGADVLVVDRSGERADIIHAQIIAAGGASSSMELDVADPAAAQVVADRVSQQWGGLDVLMVCAAAMDHWPEGDDTVEGWEAVLRVNLLLPVFLTKALWPSLVAAGGAPVVLLGSVDGLHGNPVYPAYSVSKGGLVPFTHVMASDGGPVGVRVNCIATAAIVQTGPGDLTPVTAVGSFDRVLAVTPLRRAAMVDDVANLAAFLASPQSAYVTGTVIPLDGGRLAVTPGTARPSTA